LLHPGCPAAGGFYGVEGLEAAGAVGGGIYTSEDEARDAADARDGRRLEGAGGQFYGLGGAVQVLNPVYPSLESAWFQPLSL
jgi:hypothetical protein